MAAYRCMLPFVDVAELLQAIVECMLSVKKCQFLDIYARMKRKEAVVCILIHELNSFDNNVNNTKRQI